MNLVWGAKRCVLQSFAMACLCGSSGAQEPQSAAEEQPPMFAAATALVWIDVVVTGERGHPIGPLGPEEFSLLEDGKPKKISVFRHVAPGGADTSPGQGSAGESTGVAAPEFGRLFAVLVDDLGMRSRHVERARSVVAKLLALTHHGDRVWIIAPESNVVASAHAPEGSRSILEELERVRGHLDQNLSRATSQGELRAIYWLRVERLVHTLAALRDHPGPKALIYIGESLPYSNAMGGRAAYEAAMGAADAAGASIHFLGLNDRPVTFLTHGTFGPGPSILPPPWARQPSGLLEAVAADTAGLIAPTTDAWSSAVDRLGRSSQGYYLMGILPAEPDAGQCHRIEIRVPGRKVEIRARKGYCGASLPKVDSSPGPRR